MKKVYVVTCHGFNICAYSTRKRAEQAKEENIASYKKAWKHLRSEWETNRSHGYEIKSIPFES